MQKQSMGNLIAELRKARGMTQKDLAEKMNVTDKAVSKWERNLSCPDINSLPTLAETLGVPVEELLHTTKKEEVAESKLEKICDFILKVMPLAMGIAVVVLSSLREIDLYTGFVLLGIGLFSVGLRNLQNIKEI